MSNECSVSNIYQVYFGNWWTNAYSRITSVSVFTFSFSMSVTLIWANRADLSHVLWVMADHLNEGHFYFHHNYLYNLTLINYNVTLLLIRLCQFSTMSIACKNNVIRFVCVCTYEYIHKNVENVHWPKGHSGETSGEINWCMFKWVNNLQGKECYFQYLFTINTLRYSNDTTIWVQ